MGTHDNNYNLGSTNLRLNSLNQQYFSKTNKLAASCLCLFLSSTVIAETFTVNNNSDNDEGSLRAAITAAAQSLDDDNQVVFSESLDSPTIQLESALIYDSSNNLTITGFPQLTIRAPEDDSLLRAQSAIPFSIKLEDITLAEPAIQTPQPTQEYLIEVHTTDSNLEMENCQVQGHLNTFNKKGLINIEVGGEENTMTINLNNLSVSNGSYSGNLIRATASNNLSLLKANITNSSFTNLYIDDSFIHMEANQGTSQLNLSQDTALEEVHAKGTLFSLSGDIEDAALGDGESNALSLQELTISNGSAKNIITIENNRGQSKSILRNLSIEQNEFGFVMQSASKEHAIELSNVNLQNNLLNESGFNFNDDKLEGSLVASQFKNNTVGNSPDLTTKKSMLNFSAKTITDLTLDRLLIMGNEMAGLKFYNFSASATQITNTTIANNDNSLPATNQETTSLSGDNYGGGILFSAGGEASYSVINTTISGNNAGVGGGIVLLNKAALKLASSTVANNTALEGAGLVSRSDYEGSGEKASSDVNVVNTIVSGNTASSSNSAGDLEGHFEITHSLISALDNIAGNNTSINGTEVNSINESTTNVINQDPLLEALADNGAMALTHALHQNSPAIGKGNPNAEDLPTNDQRGEGYLRVTGDRLDLGAIQFDGVVPDTPDTPDDDNPNDPDTPESEDPQDDRSVGNSSGGGSSSGSFSWLLLALLLPLTIRNHLRISHRNGG